MYAGKLVFAQVMEFAPWQTFCRLVAEDRGDFNVRSFSCLDQFWSMAFGIAVASATCPTMAAVVWRKWHF